MREVDVDGFWIDVHPVTVAEFRRFVKATGHVTVAERTPEAADYPDADPALLVPGSLVFRPSRGPVDLRDFRNWWAYRPGASWRTPEGPGSDTYDARAPPGHPHRLRGRARLRRLGRAASCPPRPSGSAPRAAGSRAPPTPGATSSRPAAR